MVTVFESPEAPVYAIVAFDESEVMRRLLPVVAASATVAVVGATARTVTVSAVVPVGVNCTVTVTAVLVSPDTAVADDAESVIEVVALGTDAVEGVDAITPNPSATTTLNAMRLKVVFVDILFLSVVVMKTFSMAALR